MAATTAAVVSGPLTMPSTMWHSPASTDEPPQKKLKHRAPPPSVAAAIAVMVDKTDSMPTPSASKSSSSSSTTKSAKSAQSVLGKHARSTAPSTVPPTIPQDDCKRYFTTVDKLKDTLAQYGVAILPSVLDAKECAHMIDGMWQYLETVSRAWKTPISRTDSDSWKEMQHLYPMHSMLLKQFGIGQTQMSWDLRQNPKVLAPFAKLWSTKPEDLLCSFDGASFHMPPEITGRGWNIPNHTWWHTDQSYLRNGFECAQSWVTAYDTDAGDATLAVLEGSHKCHADFRKHFNVQSHKDCKHEGSDEKHCKCNQANKDWYKLNDTEAAWYQQTKQCKPVFIQCPAGSMVFWDSRTIHFGREAMKGRTRKNGFRCIAYMCMTPRKQCKNTALICKKRIAAFETMRTTSHWPHKPKVNGTKPRTYGKSVIQTMTDIPKPSLTALGRRLVGYDH